MKAQELWNKYTTDETLSYEAWAFGGDPDGLAALVCEGIKTATSSGYIFYELENETIPQVGEYSVILNSSEEAVCVIQTIKVEVVPFNQVSENHAYKEGERNRTLQDWKDIHEEFFKHECELAGIEFSEKMLVVCEEFKVVYQ